ncbi:Male sterility [Cinnamomum micranthum f. kanehirae]|uniref:Fatty acyl-CoA reductase n=1 Tax=Cinnamomum micranthum f. kanehirae TaxID=337451 RepID=A0A3S3NNI5_9MAGN|nr:Male sterility [Cinnamomum micranthum f. kanehirae]
MGSEWLDSFKGKNLLITGATGFLGKVLIEKVLRTIPDVGKIFLVIKAKSKEDSMKRLQNEILQADLFKCLKEIHGESYQSFMLSKLVPVAGDVRKDDLDIEVDLAEEIAREVDIIVHLAANTTFDERYDVALDTNTRGPSRLIRFAQRCQKLKLFQHVSTAYVNGQREGRVLERPFYMGESIARERLTTESSVNSLPELDVEAEMELIGAFQENLMAKKMKEMGLDRARTFGWQDTYSFTKAMGEMLVYNMRGEIPLVIIRPSVVESTIKEPFPGWIEGNRMVDPIITYYGKGHLTSFLADPEVPIDIILVDMVVNAMLAAMAKHSARMEETQIYHITSSVTNPILCQDLFGYFFEHFEAFPYIDNNGKPVHVQPMKFFSSEDELLSDIWTNATHSRGEASMAGLAEKPSQRVERKWKKRAEQVKRLNNIYQAYFFYAGRFDDTNTRKLIEDMSEEERTMFGFDVGSINWKDYIGNIHIPGLRRHVMEKKSMNIY